MASITFRNETEIWVAWQVTRGVQVPGKYGVLGPGKEVVIRFGFWDLQLMACSMYVTHWDGNPQKLSVSRARSPDSASTSCEHAVLSTASVILRPRISLYKP